MKVGAFFVCLVFFLVIVLGAFLYLSLDPNVIKPQLQEHLESITGLQVKIGPVSVHWQGIHPELGLKDVEIIQRKGREPILRAEYARAKIRWRPLLKRQLILKYLDLIKPAITISRNEKGEWNWLPAEESSGIKTSGLESLKDKKWQIAIMHFSASDAALYYADRSETPFFHEQWNHINIRAESLPEKGTEFEIALSETLKLNFRWQRRLLEIHLQDANRLEMQAAIQNPLEDARISGHLKMENYFVRVIKALPDNRRRGFESIVRLEADFSGSGYHPETLKRNFIFKGTFQMDKGILLGLPVSRNILDGLAPIPGFRALTEKSFPEDFEDLYDAEDSPFNSASGKLQMASGKIFLEDLEFRHPYFALQVDGFWDLIQDRFDLKGEDIFIGKFSSFLKYRVPDMDVLEDHPDQLFVPYTFQGNFEKADFRPNLFYIANRLIQMKGEELASRGIQKINEFMEAQQR